MLLTPTANQAKSKGTAIDLSIYLSFVCIGNEIEEK